jgi:hypothetical protein
MNDLEEQTVRSERDPNKSYFFSSSTWCPRPANHKFTARNSRATHIIKTRFNQVEATGPHDVWLKFMLKFQTTKEQTVEEKV